MSAGDSELRIVVSHPSSGQGGSPAVPVTYHWRWYHHVPSLGLWGLVLLLLAGRRANRNLQAWTILIPLSALVAIWRVPLALVGASVVNWEAFGICVLTLAMGLSVLWLLGDWLARRRVWTALSASLGTVAVVVALSYQMHYEQAWRSEFAILIACGVSAVALIGALALAGFSCRRTYTTTRLIIWLALWTWIVSAGLMIVGMSIQAVLINPLMLPVMLIMGLVMSLFLAGGLFLLALPFLILSFKCPLYRERLEGALRLRPPSDPAPTNAQAT